MVLVTSTAELAVAVSYSYKVDLTLDEVEAGIE